MKHDSTSRAINEQGIRVELKNWWQKIKVKSALSHFGLLLTLTMYTVAGGLVFRELEYPAEISRLRKLENITLLERQRLISIIVNSTDVSNMATLVSVELQRYERVLETAVTGGLHVTETSSELVLQPTSENWSILQAVFFSSTVLTTIGYGNIVPMTFWGRQFCMLFALVGIPLTLTVIADWGRMFAGVVSALVRRLPRPPNALRPPGIIAGSQSGTHRGAKRALYALAAVIFLFVYLGIGAGLFMLWEEDWTFFDGFYFCFITMTTIGFGDLVPKKPKYMLVCTLYILVGLALTSTIIELVRRQYAQSWRRLQALSGPLADTLRRLGDAAGGRALDIAAFNSDLRRVLTVITMPKWSLANVDSKESRGGASRKRHSEWEDVVEAVLRDITAAAPPARSPGLLQIVIYESSV